MATTTRWLAVVLAATLAVGPSAAGAGGGKLAEPDGTALAKGNSEFAFDLYARLRARDGNLFFSPYSISNALAMTYAGARGPTATQMAAALRFPMDGDRLHRSFAKVNGDVNGARAKGGAELHVANALWTQMGIATLPAFQATVKNLYGAGLTPLDFRRTPEKARIAINAWVEQQTRDRIKELIPEGMLNSDTRAVLTNAIYFKGKWKSAFPQAATRNDKFTLSTGKTIGDVPLMSQQGAFRYLDGGTFQALELPYDANQQSMIVFLPKRADGLAELEKTLAPARVTDWLAGMSRPPRCTSRCRDSRSPRSFSSSTPWATWAWRWRSLRGKADFSGIATEPLCHLGRDSQGVRGRERKGDGGGCGHRRG